MNELVFTPMTISDLPEVLRIERESFVSPWSRPMFERDILHNKLAHIFTVTTIGSIIGYYSLWKIVDEGHLVTIAVDSGRRRQGIGSAILREVFRKAAELRIGKITLEVRETNREAIRLYMRFGFVKGGVRLKYYEDGTNAWIMDYDMTRDQESAKTA